MAQSAGHRSLTAKLAYLMTFVVMLTVFAITIQSSRKFSSYILQTIEETSTAMAERSASEISGTIDTWIAQISVTTSKLSGAMIDTHNNDTELAAVLRNERDFIGIALYSVRAGDAKLIRQARQRPLPQGASGEGYSQATIDSSYRAMTDLASELSKNSSLLKEGRYVRNITPTVKIPTLLLAVKFAIPNRPDEFAVMISAISSTRLQIALPQSRYTSGYIISSDGAIFASTDEVRMLNTKPIRGNELVNKARQRQAPSGFVADFMGREQRRKLGAYAQLPGTLPLYLIVERDRDAAFQVVVRTYFSAALWGILILLLSAMAVYVSAGTVTRNLRELVSATKRIASGDFGVRLQPHSADEVAELGHSVNHMASKIQLLMRNEVEKARFEKELETARMVQSTFFPKKDVKSAYLAVTGNYQPATECGGDLWGHYVVGEDRELVFIADAMGHGAPAALVTAIAYAVCQSVASILNEKSTIDHSPAALLRRLNNIILDAVDGKISMTFFVALFDFRSGKVTYANAGHNFPFILTADKDDKRAGKAAKKSAGSSPTMPITLTLQGTPLGVDRSAEYKEKEIDMSPGDKIFFFTDGLIENAMPGQGPLGRKELIERVCQLGNLTIGEIKEKTLELGRSIFGQDNLQDDVTVVVAAIDKSWIKPEGSLNPGAPIPIFDLGSPGESLSNGGTDEKRTNIPLPAV